MKTPREILIELARDNPREGFVLEAYNLLRKSGMAPDLALLAVSSFVDDLISFRETKE